MAQPAETIPPALVEPMRVNEPPGERDSKVEVVGSKEALAEELLKKSKPAKVPTRPTVPMRSKSTRGRSAQTTLLRRARTVMQYQRGRRGNVIIVDLLGSTYAGGEKIEEKEREGVQRMRGGYSCGPASLNEQDNVQD